MRKYLLFLLAASAIHAAIIRGTVVEHVSGKPLARTLVVLSPLAPTPGGPQSTRTNTWGAFEFSALPAGAFLISASRRGFPPVHYGQKNWRAAGAPIVLAEDQSTFLNVRMPRYGAITGTVVDENDVGLPEHEVVAYRNTRPPRLVGKAQADDRGVFRIAGLDPGRYLVRTVGRQYEDGGYLPTFFRETQRIDEAAFLEVDLDRETFDAKVRPVPGRLFTVDGSACTTGPGPITLILVSDIGRETQILNLDPLNPGCVPFQFPNKPPGPYEIWATAPVRARGFDGAYAAFSLDRDRPSMRIALLPQANIFLSFKGPQGQLIDANTVKLQVRKIDLAGPGPAEALRIDNGRTQFVQGRWQVQVVPNGAYVATDFSGPKGERPEGGRADGWNEFVITGGGMMAYVLSSKPSGIHGIVSYSHDPIGGAPVFLEPWDPVNRKRLMDPRTVRADMRGQYQFFGLAPGTYRLVSTFEYQNPEANDIDTMLPRTIVIEEGRDQQQDIDLYVIR
jgi:hypothetical protein